MSQQNSASKSLSTFIMYFHILINCFKVLEVSLRKYYINNRNSILLITPFEGWDQQTWFILFKKCLSNLYSSCFLQNYKLKNNFWDMKVQNKSVQ